MILSFVNTKTRQFIIYDRFTFILQSMKLVRIHIMDYSCPSERLSTASTKRLPSMISLYTTYRILKFYYYLVWDQILIKYIYFKYNKTNHFIPQPLHSCPADANTKCTDFKKPLIFFYRVRMALYKTGRLERKFRRFDSLPYTHSNRKPYLRCYYVAFIASILCTRLVQFASGRYVLKAKPPSTFREMAFECVSFPFCLHDH